MLEYRLETRLSRNIGKKRDKDNNLQKLTKGNDFCMGEVDWILCPFCGSKTRTKIRKDTVLINFRQGCYYHRVISKKLDFMGLSEKSGSPFETLQQ